MADTPKQKQLMDELLRRVGAAADEPSPNAHPPPPARPIPAGTALVTPAIGRGGLTRRAIAPLTPHHPPAAMPPVGRGRAAVGPPPLDPTMPWNIYAANRAAAASRSPAGAAAAGTPAIGAAAVGTPAFSTPAFGTPPTGPRPHGGVTFMSPISDSVMRATRPDAVMMPPPPVPAGRGRPPLNPAASPFRPTGTTRPTPRTTPRRDPAAPRPTPPSTPRPTPPSTPLPSPVAESSRRPRFVARVPQTAVFGDDSEVEGDEPGDYDIAEIPEREVLDSSTLLNEPLLRQWRKECRLSSQELPPDAAVTPTPNTESPFVQAFQARPDYSELCATVHQVAMETDEKALREHRKENFYTLMLPVLLRMDTLVLQEVLGGNLMKAYHDGPPSFRRQVDILHVLGRRTVPVIYLRLQTDDKGNPPTPAEYAKASKRMRSYATQQDERSNYLAGRVDKHIADWPQELIDQGIRRYMRDNAGAKPKMDGSEKHKPSAAQKIIDFCDLLDAETEPLKDTEQYDQPCERPKAYVGWARCFSERLKSHNKHSNSSMLMGLMEATCAVLFPEENYRMRALSRLLPGAFVVGLIGDADQARVAEVFFSLVTDSYVKTGGGFAASDAGISADSAARVKAEHYNIYVRAMLKETRFNANFKRLTRGTQKEAIKKACDELEQKQAQLDKLNDDAYQLRQEIEQAARSKLERSQASLKALKEFEEGMRKLATVRDVVEEQDVKDEGSWAHNDWLTRTAAVDRGWTVRK